MSFDLYDFLGLKNKSQQLFVKHNPHIYIYGDLVINHEYETTIKLERPDKTPLYTQTGSFMWDGSKIFVIIDTDGREIYFETLIQLPDDPKTYDYSVLLYNDDDYLIKTINRDKFVKWTYNFDKGIVTASTYTLDMECTRIITHAIKDIKTIIYKPKNLVGNK